MLLLYLGVRSLDHVTYRLGSQVVLVVKNPPAKAGEVRDAGSITVSRRFPGGGQATHSSTLTWEIPWTEQTSGLQSTGS